MVTSASTRTTVLSQNLLFDGFGSSTEDEVVAQFSTEPAGTLGPTVKGTVTVTFWPTVRRAHTHCNTAGLTDK
jgi:hypothetical protein